MPNQTQGSLIYVEGWGVSKKVLEDQRRSQKKLIPAPEVSLKHILQNFYGGQTAEHVQEAETHII